MRSRTPTRRPTALTIDGWRLAARLVRARISGRGPCADCDGSCCRHGAYVSLAERDRILAHATGIGRMMDASQPRDPERWFDRRRHRDSDFPGGVANATRVQGRKCVFRTREGLCAIQRWEERTTLAGGERLKPFYCRLFPLTTDGRTVDFHPLVAGARPCCTIDRRGETRAVDAWRDELRMLVGTSGLRRLRTVLTPSRRR